MPIYGCDSLLFFLQSRVPPNLSEGDFQGYLRYEVDKAANYLVMYEIQLGNNPVLIIEFKQPSVYDVLSDREEADIQIRERFRGCIGTYMVVCMYFSHYGEYKSLPNSNLARHKRARHSVRGDLYTSKRTPRRHTTSSDRSLPNLGHRHCTSRLMGARSLNHRERRNCVDS